jgi:repressor LexA
MIGKIRKEKGMTKTELAKLTGINICHLTHIEKGERNPSHKALRNICKALNVPYQQLMYTYDKQLNEDQETYNYVNHIAYDKVLAVDNINTFIDCPPTMPSASLAIKVNGSYLEPKYSNGDYVFVEFNSPLTNGDIAVISLNGDVLIRKYSNKEGKICLSVLDKSMPKVTVSGEDNFYIIGKVLGK